MFTTPELSTFNNRVRIVIIYMVTAADIWQLCTTSPRLRQHVNDAVTVTIHCDFADGSEANTSHTAGQYDDRKGGYTHVSNRCLIKM